ncbi:MAG: TonB-dependent receptor [Pseudomonadota bacterium]
MSKSAIAFSVVLSLCSTWTFAQDDEDIEEIIVTGTQIRGASISEALPVSVVGVEEIEALGINSGDELLDFIAENGQNFFNEAENISGGVNAARGDIGAFNLRNLGTGNTLALLNGRRMVNSASFQTEEVGGSFVPVNSVNSNTLPVFGIRQVEVLRDGASAIYGADAVAGVINTVLKSNAEGLTVRGRHGWYDHVGRDDQTISLEWGKFFNDRKTNLSVFADYYRRDRVNSQEEARWANSDFRDRIPADSLWSGNTSFRNNSANSLFPQFDLVSSVSASGIPSGFTDSRGEFETRPSTDPDCVFDIGFGLCGIPDGSGTVRYNLNENRDLNSALERANLFVFLNHDFDNGIQSFTEVGYYQSKTNLVRHPSAPFSTVKLRVGAQNFYNPFGPCGSPNRLPDSVIGTGVPCEGLEIEIDNIRFAEVPRIVDNDGETYRLLQGFRGTFQDKWDWETALLWSKAEKEDITRNRVSNTLMQEALEDPTAAAYNPFSGGVNSNIERALVDVFRNNEADLTLLDFKISTADLFEVPGGAVGFLAGIEYREESFEDDRDPRLDGTIVFTDFQGDTFPFVSDVVNSSPTPDNSGERDVLSVFTEFQIPLHDTLDVQVALRYEDFSDVGSTTVPKIALGWRPLEKLLIRGSWSEAFRAPNLVTINETIVARQNTRNDFACEFAANNGGDPMQDILDCSNSIQRIAQGSRELRPEQSDNYSFGVVVDPLPGLTLTLDYWAIEKEDTIGLFGEENHTILDLVQRLEAGTANCAGFQGNPAVSRADDIDPEAADIYLAAGICPAGDIEFVSDQYANLDTRTVRGYDVGLYYSAETRAGEFDIRYVASLLDEFEQEPGGQAAILLEAQESGLLPTSIPVDGFADLIRRDGNQKEKHTLRVSWRKENWGAALTGRSIGDFFQTSLTLDGPNGDIFYTVPSVQTYNVSADYRFGWGDSDARIRFGVNNFTDKRAPLADRFFGYFADAHRDLGRSYYLDFRFDM